MKLHHTALLFFAVLLLCSSLVSATGMDEKILTAQNGYETGMPKIAIIRVQADSFSLVNAAGIIQFKGKLGERKYWSFSDEWVQWADFSALNTPGSYKLQISGTSWSRQINIVADPFAAIARAGVKALYFNRCSYPIAEKFGGQWKRESGHPDTQVLIHKSAVSEGRPENFFISSPGGWYDAGNYNKYIVNSGISTYTLLAAFEFFPDYWKHVDLNIPESGNQIPDILDEALYNLRWMLTMQDKDGGVYHKLTTKAFEGFIMPSQANDKRYVVKKSTAASLDFAATMAHASILFANFASVLPGLSDSCRQAANKAWKWSLKNPGILFKNPPDIFTGEYGDGNLKDEWFWAGTEMSFLSGYAYPDSLLDKLEFKTPSWNSVATLGILTTLKNGHISADLQSKCSALLYQYVDQLVDAASHAGYPVSLDHFAWGSNSDVANQGMLKMISFSLTGNTKYMQSALQDMDYLTGVNPTGFCYITGIGEKSPMHIHHRPSASDGIVDPVPGFLAGGPNLVVFTDCPNAIRSKLPALSYVDEACSYSTNEIAINWNTPLAFLAGALSNSAMVLLNKK
jgi:endoglucanase